MAGDTAVARAVAFAATVAFGVRRKKARAACPSDPGLEPGTCRVLGEGPPLHARGAV